VINITSDLLTSNGFYEMKSNSLTKSSYYDLDGSADPNVVRLHNPLSQDLSLMRRNLLYGGLEAIAHNINRKHPDLMLYEFGNCYQEHALEGADELLAPFEEQLHLGIFMSGKYRQGNWTQAVEENSFYGLKKYVESILIKVGIDPENLETGGGEHPDYSDYLAYELEGLHLVGFGVVAEHLLDRFEIRQPVFAAEFNWDRALAALNNRKILFKPLPKFQVVTRDFSLMLEKSVTFNALKQVAFNTEKKFLKEVSLFDVYEGDKIEKGKKSYALSFTLLDEDKTLTDKQIDKVMLNLARAFEREFNAVIRGMN
jgi:phenylalanyl-tRNA synthetase beta chain